MPQFKLLIAGNHKPGLRSVDEAIRRRLHLLPFTVTIPEAERDKTLAEKLKAEAPGILQWAIDGCHIWQEQGLAPPAIVRAATDAYLEAQDALAAWINDCCQRDVKAWEPSATLWASWKAWAERAGLSVGIRTNFPDALARQGVTEQRKNTARGYQGLRLRGTNDPWWERDYES